MRSIRRGSIAIEVKPRFTLDTNVLVYSVNTHEAEKHIVAMTILDRAVDSDCVLTLQSISEFYFVVTRKGMMSPLLAAELAEKWLTIFPHVAVSPSAIRTALPNAVQGIASYWDALLVATAAEAGCMLALSEDMADGTSLEGIHIHNPFTNRPELTDLVRQLLG